MDKNTSDPQMDLQFEKPKTASEQVTLVIGILEDAITELGEEVTKLTKLSNGLLEENKQLKAMLKIDLTPIDHKPGPENIEGGTE